MFENIVNFFKNLGKKNEKNQSQENSKNAAKERLHLVLMQDRANVSADFLELMKQEIIDVIKKYIEIDENEIDVRLTNKENEDGTNGAPALYANIPILNIKNDARKIGEKEVEESKKTNKDKEDKPKEEKKRKEENEENNKQNKEEEQKEVEVQDEIQEIIEEVIEEPEQKEKQEDKKEVKSEK